MSIDSRDQLLARSALQKQKTGDKITAAEQAALDRVRRATLFDMLRDVTPGTFDELFDIQTNQRHQWEEVLKLPCGRGRDSINMLEVFSKIREIFSRRSELASETPEMAELKVEKIQQEIQKLKHQNFELATEAEMIAKERMPKATIVAALDKMADAIRGVSEQLARKTRLTGEEAQRMVNHALAQYNDELDSLKSL